jgi:hypothetical protein
MDKYPEPKYPNFTTADREIILGPLTSLISTLTNKGATDQTKEQKDALKKKITCLLEEKKKNTNIPNPELDAARKNLFEFEKIYDKEDIKMLQTLQMLQREYDEAFKAGAERYKDPQKQKEIQQYLKEYTVLLDNTDAEIKRMDEDEMCIRHLLFNEVLEYLRKTPSNLINEELIKSLFTQLGVKVD